MARTNPGSYSFLDFTLDLGAERLLRGNAVIKLRPKSFQVLRYMVERRGRLVTRDELMEALWGDVVVTEESVAKCIADIRKALGDESQTILRTAPRRGFVFEAEARLLETGPAAVSPVAPSRRRALMLAGLAAAGSGAALVPVWYARQPVFEAIAVLPFESLSIGEEHQYFADGITEALITGLGQSSPLRVIARTSVNQYQKTKKPIGRIAEELNVDVVVEGTVTRSGSRLRVTANLIQVSPEKHIWAQAYERDLRDSLALQNEVAGAIAEAVASRLGQRRQVRIGTGRPTDPAAQAAYWKARYLLDHRFRASLEDYRKMLDYSEQAVRIDPGYAPAHAVLSWAYATRSDIGEMFPSQVMPLAKKAAEQAIALDGGLVDGHVALGYILLIYEWDWDGTEREALRAIRLNPSSAEGHKLLAWYLSAVGRVDEAVAEIRRARQLDPFSFTLNWDVGRILCFARRYDEALAELRQAADMQQNSPAVDIWTFKTYWATGQRDQAIAVDMKIRGYRDGLDGNALRDAYSAKGPPGYWSKVRELVLPKYRANPIGWYRLAEISAYLGEKEEALDWLEKAFAERPNWIPWLKVDPSIDPLRPDPRLAALLQRMGLKP